MAFYIHSTADGRAPSTEYLPCGAIVPKAGMAMKMATGKLAAAGATDAPTYICMQTRQTACTDGELIPVVRVLPDMIFGTSFSVAAGTVKLGDKVTLSADSMQVTATTVSGVAEVVGMEGTDAGAVCMVRF